MAIELVTGAPGAGKTTYAVAKRMREEEGREFDYEDALGVLQHARRRIFAGGFKELLIEHERLGHPLTGERTGKRDIDRWNRLDADDEPVMVRRAGQPAWTHEDIDGRSVPLERTLFNWWLWVEPGDMLCYDEIQFVVPRGSMGRVAPFWVRSLEVHRHYGIDLLFITQHPQLLDTPFRALVNPHRHVRAVSILGSVCAIYTWDHASNPERYTNAIKTPFIRRRAHHRLFKSTVAVMKQPAAGRGYLVAIPLLAVLAVWLGWRGLTGSAKASTVPLAAARAASAPRASAALPAPPPVRPAGWADVPKLTGCYTVGDICKCLGAEGRPVSIAPAMCRVSAASFDGLVQWEPRAPVLVVPAAPAVSPAVAALPVPPPAPSLKTAIFGG